jgi:acyl-CoA reductase-like NAD-dependent aldehyde dehydrogenase
MKVADGFEPGAVIGPLIDMKAVEKVEAHIADAVKKGAKVVTGGKRSALGGTFFEPTVLTDVTTDMVITKEETFGPVAPLYRFKTDDEAIKMANDTEFGLAAYFYSRDIGRIWRVAEGLEYGIVGINEGIISTEIAPFGGMKESGIGPAGSPLGLEIRHRGIPRGQISLHGRHRPLKQPTLIPSPTHGGGNEWGSRLVLRLRRKIHSTSSPPRPVVQRSAQPAA